MPIVDSWCRQFREDIKRFLTKAGLPGTEEQIDEFENIFDCYAPEAAKKKAARIRVRVKQREALRNLVAKEFGILFLTEEDLDAIENIIKSWRR